MHLNQTLLHHNQHYQSYQPYQPPHLVNNSLKPGIQHKRISFDSTLYSLVHKKMLRKAVIDRNFHDSLTSFQPVSHSQPKGFKGKPTPNSTIYHKKMGTKTHYKLQGERRQRQRQLQLTAQRALNRVIQQRRMWIGHQGYSQRPNMMCNLDLYRKGFRRSYKQKSIRQKTEKSGQQEIICEWNRMKTVI